MELQELNNQPASRAEAKVIKLRDNFLINTLQDVNSNRVVAQLNNAPMIQYGGIYKTRITIEIDIAGDYHEVTDDLLRLANQLNNHKDKTMKQLTDKLSINIGNTTHDRN